MSPHEPRRSELRFQTLDQGGGALPSAVARVGVPAEYRNGTTLCAEQVRSNFKDGEAAWVSRAASNFPRCASCAKSSPDERASVRL